LKIAYLRDTLFSSKARGIAVIFTIAIIVVSYSLFFYLQSTTESNIRNSIFEQQKARQMQSTQALTQYLAILDQNSDELIHPVKSGIGKPFFGNYVQNITGHNKSHFYEVFSLVAFY
jgi:ABC-type transporter MlaC component